MKELIQKKWIMLVGVLLIIMIVILTNAFTSKKPDELYGNIEIKWELAPNGTDLHLPVDHVVDIGISYRFFENTVEITKSLTDEEKQEIIYEKINISVEDESVLDFNAYVVTTKETGRTTISMVEGEQEYHITVLVGPQATDFETNDAKEVALSDPTKQWIKQVIQPYAGLGTITFEVEDSNIAEVDASGLIIPVSIGSTNVKVTLTSQDESNIVEKDVLLKVIK